MDDPAQSKRDAEAYQREQRKKGEDLAYERGQENARMEAHFAELDRHVLDINGSVARNAEETKALRGCVEGFIADQGKRDAVTDALKKVVRESAAKSVSTRVFLVSLGGFFVALTTLMLGVVR